MSQKPSREIKLDTANKGICWLRLPEYNSLGVCVDSNFHIVIWDRYDAGCTVSEDQAKRLYAVLKEYFNE